MRDVLIFAGFSFREAQRRRVLWAALLLGVAYIALYAVGFYFIHREWSAIAPDIDLARNAGFQFNVMAGLYVVSFLGVMLAVLTGVGSLSGEISSQTMQALAVKPFRRGVIVLGKWLGLSAMLVCYILLLGGGVIMTTYLIAAYVPHHAFGGLLLICLQALIMLSLSLLGGTRLSTVANGVVGFMLYGLAFVGGWTEQIGSFTQNETAIDIGIASSLLVPSEAMWKMAASLMQPPLGILGFSPFASASAPSDAMLVYALAYLFGTVALAVYSFEHRDI